MVGVGSCFSQEELDAVTSDYYKTYRAYMFVIYCDNPQVIEFQSFRVSPSHKLQSAAY